MCTPLLFGVKNFDLNISVPVMLTKCWRTSVDVQQLMEMIEHVVYFPKVLLNPNYFTTHLLPRFTDTADSVILLHVCFIKCVLSLFYLFDIEGKLIG